MRSKDTLAHQFTGVLVFALFFFTVCASAQEESKTAARVVTIKSDPPGALVLLSGEHRFAGRTPFILPYPLTGKYDISTNKRGYQSFRSRYSFTTSSRGFIMLKLEERTSGMALLRSFVAPGWGQLYSERKTSGLIWFGATVGALTAFGVNELNFRAAQDDDRAALSAYNRALNLGDNTQQQAAKLARDKTLRRVNNAEEDRNLSLYIAGGVWLLNLLDSVIFFPNHAENAELFRRASLGLSHKENTAKLNLNISLDKR